MNKIIVGRNYSLFFIWAEMKYSLISVLEYRFGVFSPSAPESYKNKKFDFEPIFLKESPKGDFEIELKDEKLRGEFYAPLVLFALKTYFFKIRALPNTELEITEPVSNFKLDNTDKIILTPSKCKYKFSNCKSQISGVELEYKSGGDFLFFRAESLSGFDENALSLALLKQNDTSDTAIAYSEKEDFIQIKKRGRAALLECAVMLSRLLISEGRFGLGSEIEFLFNSGQSIKIKNLNGSRLEISLVPRPLGFFG